MRSICPNLRSTLVALLTIALLIGPCLSFTGYFGPSAVHAHGGMSQIASQDGGSGHGHAHHGAGQPTHGQQGSGHHQSPNQSPISCEELCEGWAVKQTQRLTAIENTSGADDAFMVPVLIELKREFPLTVREHRRPSDISDMAVPAASLAAYRLTGRFRL